MIGCNTPPINDRQRGVAVGNVRGAKRTNETNDKRRFQANTDDVIKVSPVTTLTNNAQRNRLLAAAILYLQL